MLKNSSYVDQPCSRCGQQKKISKTWTETIKTFSGTTTVECSQIICTNTACQKEFDKKRLEDNATRKKRQDEKEERENQRKERVQLSTRKALIK